MSRKRYVPADADRWVRPSEAAEIMGVGQSTVMRLCARGDLKCSRVSSRRVSIRIADIHAYMAQRESVQPTSLRLLDTVRPMRRAGVA